MGFSFHYSGLQNSMDYIVHGVTKSLRQLRDFHFHFLTLQGQRRIKRIKKALELDYLEFECAVLLGGFSHVRVFAILWTLAYQAPPSMGFSRQEYWSGLPFPSPMHESEK